MGLEMVSYKTEAILITGRRKIKKVTFKIGTHVIESNKEVKVSPHLTAVADKAHTQVMRGAGTNNAKCR